MAQKTKRESLNEQLSRLQQKLLTENLKTSPDSAVIAGLVESIKDAERRLASDDPDLEKPAFNWSAV